jgi:SAM-dependent methyltransferase
MSLLQRFFPGLRTSRKLLSETRSALSNPAATMRDLPIDQVEAINRSSRVFYQNSDLKEFWLNKPFSDPKWSPSLLWRFGLLLSGLGLRPGYRVLDFGCGPGWTSIMMARMGVKVIGIDISAEAILLAKEAASRALLGEQTSNLEFHEYNGVSIPWPNEYFDCVVVFESLHHVPNPQTMLNEFHRILFKHGQFGFAEPGGGHRHGTMAERIENQHGILELDLSLEELYRNATTAGFQHLEVLIPALPPNWITLSMERLRWYLRGISWLVPHNFIRAAILNGPVGILKKSEYENTSLNPRSIRAEIKTSQNSVAATTGETFNVMVNITNRSDTVWLKEGRHGVGYVRLGTHLLDEKGNTREQDFGRAELPHDMSKGDTIPLNIQLQAPKDKGNFQICFDMVNEGIFWFAEEGSKTSCVQLTVL